MPATEQSVNWRVTVYPQYSETRVIRLLQRIKPRDETGERTTPRQWLGRRAGYFTHFKRPKVVVVVMRPRQRVDPGALARRAARLLEARSGLVLDWCWGEKGESIYLVVKILARDRAGKNREFWLERDDIWKLKELVPGKERLKQRERGR